MTPTPFLTDEERAVVESVGEPLIQKIARLYAAREGGWLDKREAAAYANMHPKVLERLARRKKIQHGKHGREYRFRAEWLYNYLMKRGFDGTVK